MPSIEDLAARIGVPTSPYDSTDPPKFGEVGNDLDEMMYRLENVFGDTPLINELLGDTARFMDWDEVDWEDLADGFYEKYDEYEGSSRQYEDAKAVQRSQVNRMRNT